MNFLKMLAAERPPTENKEEIYCKASAISKTSVCIQADDFLLKEGMSMNQILKSAKVEKSITPTEMDMLLINKQTLRTLSAGEVFVFKLAACGDQVDRDH